MEPKYKVVVHYVYSWWWEAYADNIELDILSWLTYTITSPTIQYYEPNKPIVTWKIEGNDVEETVIYTPNQDKNLNGIADEVEPKYTVKYTDWVEWSIVFRDQTSIWLLSWLETPKFEWRIARKDYIFSWWVPKVEEKVYKNATYTATWKEDENNNGIDDITEEKYKITIKDWEIVLAIIELIPWMVIKLPELPWKNWYAFDGWEWLPKDWKSINKDLEITARRKKIQENSNSTWGWWGWWGSKNEEEHHSAPNTWEDKKIDLPFIIEKLKENVLDRWLNPINTNNNSSNSNEKEIEINTWDSSLINHELAPSNGRKSSYGSTLDEIKAAYEWAYSKDITTKKSIEEANPEGPLYRQHMAKMMVNFAANELWMEIPDETPRDCKWLDWSEAYESKEMEEYAVKACKLWLMWINIEYFNPGVVTTRAQFWTILSRLLFGFTYEWWDPYYKNHLEALKIRGIMTKIDNPKDRVELREWVRVMLMRVKDYKENLK